MVTGLGLCSLAKFLRLANTYLNVQYSMLTSPYIEKDRQLRRDVINHTARNYDVDENFDYQ